MNFTSWQFGIFIFIVFGAYYLLPVRTLQIQLLVVASLFFYGWASPNFYRFWLSPFSEPICF